MTKWKNYYIQAIGNPSDKVSSSGLVNRLKNGLRTAICQVHGSVLIDERIEAHEDSQLSVDIQSNAHA